MTHFPREQRGLCGEFRGPPVVTGEEAGKRLSPLILHSPGDIPSESVCVPLALGALDIGGDLAGGPRSAADRGSDAAVTFRSGHDCLGDLSDRFDAGCRRRA